MTTPQFNKILRRSIRVFALVLVMIWGVFRIAIPLINQKDLYLKPNDLYLVLGCVGMVVAMELIRAFISKFFGVNKQ